MARLSPIVTPTGVANLHRLAQRKKVLTLVTATKDINISEVAVLAKLMLLS
ncbi:hypothetical protein LAUMK13_05716 [Mycobacterium innocens]|uniref:Uncharacterized protein n=1 Tax=Mycobacterium innocens TaxID=2341083 RepID=A0A498QMB5_9MYCO|nr:MULTISPECIES: hypothetical protein [Mycobacterium]VBA46709.1 hypothetical protein LAUMK13_05716 [Mycobacterium innocens]